MEKKILIIGTVWPEPNSSAAGTRMMQLIKLFISENYQVIFASAASLSDFMFPLHELNVETVTIKLNHSSFDDFIVQLNPQIVMFDRFISEEQYGWRVAENCPNALRILDTEDLHCLRYARQNAFKQKRTFVLTDILEEEISKREIASILKCDISLIISKAEMKILTEIFKIEKQLLHYLPFMLAPINEKMLTKYPSFEERKDFISIGNFLHEPNYNAVLYLKEEIWPIIKKVLPKAQLHIYGAYTSQKVNNLHNERQGFIIKGRAESVEEIMSGARICLAPLRFGAGLKGKLIDAMLYGTPSVTTKIGAEAMHNDLFWNGFICDNTLEFAEAAINLYTNKNIWLDKQQNAIDIINYCYDKETFETEFIAFIKQVQRNIQKHRKENFMGSLLMHHNALSSKYLSKWIETKNNLDTP